MRANRGHVPLVTIDIGGNDVGGCAPGNASCVAAGLAAIDRNVPMIVAGLTAAAGSETRFAMMTYYDPFLEYWVTGPSGQTIAQQSLPNVDSLNGALVRDFGPRFVVADVAKAFSTDDMKDIVSTPNHGMVPEDVAVICRLTGGCDHGFDLHANGLGHQLIADTFFATITAGLVPPVAPSAAQIKKSLSAALVPHGKSAKIAAILRAGGYTVSFKALAAGNAEIDWYVVPPHAHRTVGKNGKAPARRDRQAQVPQCRNTQPKARADTGRQTAPPTLTEHTTHRQRQLHTNRQACHRRDHDLHARPLTGAVAQSRNNTDVQRPTNDQRPTENVAQAPQAPQSPQARLSHGASCRVCP